MPDANSFNDLDILGQAVNNLPPSRTAFAPVFTLLTEVGTVTKTGYWIDIGGTIFVTIRITTSGGGTSAAVAGTTYVTLPVSTAASVPAHSSNVTTLLGIGTGLVTGNKLYVPAWIATTNEIVISAIYPRA